VIEAKADWYPDPTGRHQHRYWGGRAWTDHVADNGVQGLDPTQAAPPGGARQGSLRLSVLRMPSLSPAITQADLVALFGTPDGETPCDDGDVCFQWFDDGFYVGAYFSPSGSFTNAMVLDAAISDKQVRIDRYLAAVRR
jgi:hypothetical protein